jgi:hypothetical protein
MENIKTGTYGEVELLISWKPGKGIGERHRRGHQGSNIPSAAECSKDVTFFH